MNDMWSEMSEQAREEYKEYFIRYHNEVARWQFHKNLFAAQFLLCRNKTVHLTLTNISSLA